MKVIVDRRRAYQLDCPSCKSTLEYTEWDIHWQDDDYDGLHYHSYIKCPLCGRKIHLSIDGESTNIEIKEVERKE